MNPQAPVGGDNAAMGLHPEELKRLSRHIEGAVRDARSDHERRLRMFDRYKQLFLNIAKDVAPKEGGSQYVVPLLRWVLMMWWAQTAEAVIGEDAEVVAVPRGAHDQKLVAKVGRFMTWLLDEGMDFRPAWLRWSFQAGLNGRAVAYRPWEARTGVNSNGEPELLYDGPGLHVPPPEDVILPADEHALTVHDTEWVALVLRLTPQQLLNGERVAEINPSGRGRYFGIRENFKRIWQLAQEQYRGIFYGTDLDTATKDEAEGVTYSGGGLSGRGKLAVIEWYGKWRLPLDDSQDVPLDDFDRRSMDETEIVVRLLPADNWRVIGIDRLSDLYGHIEHKRPFADLRVLHYGDPWPLGLGAILEQHQSELTVIARILLDGAKFASYPAIGYKPGAGFDPAKLKLEPRLTIPMEDPSGMRVIEISVDYQGLMAAMQWLQSIVERETGISDLTLGRSTDSPSTPRTATMGVALMESGNVRRKIDLTGIRTDLAAFLRDVWEMYSTMGGEQVFFRVAEEQAGGLFDVAEGRAVMGADERAGRYDFRLQMATSTWSKAAAKEDALQLYQVDLTNPLIASNPVALWHVANRVHKAMGDDNFADMIPRPPEPDLPKTPDQEWTAMLQGEDAPVHPMDNDAQHLAEHDKQFEALRRSENPDVDAMHRLMAHMQQQAQQHLLKQSVVSGLGAAMQQRGMGMGMGQNPLAAMSAAGQPAAPGQPPSGPAAPSGGVPGPMQTEMPAAGENIQQNVSSLLQPE